MPWPKRSLEIVAIKKRRRMEAIKDAIQEGLDRGRNKRQIAEKLGVNPPDVVEFTLDTGMRPFPDLGYKVITTYTLKCARGHFHGALEQLPVMFKKRQGWFCILKAYEVRELKAAALAAQATEQELIALRAEVVAMKALVKRELGGDHELEQHEVH